VRYQKNFGHVPFDAGGGVKNLKNFGNRKVKIAKIAKTEIPKFSDFA
jgi:hypothetical protein